MQFLQTCDLAKEVGRLRRELSKRQESLVEAMRRELPPSVSYSVPDGGMNMWLELPESIDAGDLIMTALKNGVSFVPGALFYDTSAKANTLRISFGGLDSDKIPLAVRRLGQSIRAHENLGRQEFTALV